MKSRLLFLLLNLLLGVRALAQPSTIMLRPLEHYSIDKKISLHSGLNYIVVTKASQFNKLFGIGKEPINKANYPDFSKEVVLIIAMPETKRETKISFTDGMRAGNFAEVNFKERRSYPLTYSSIPVSVVTMPKYKGVQEIRFYENKRLKETVKIK